MKRGAIACLTAAALLLSCLLTGGCSTGGSFGRYEEGVAPNEQQIEVALQLGYSQKDVEGMSDGMSKAQWNAIVPAAAMIQAMETRYGVPFIAIDIATPWSMVRYWELTCMAAEGDFAGMEVSVRRGESDTAIDDTYYGLLRSSQYSDEIRFSLKEVMEKNAVSESGYTLQATIASHIGHDMPLDCGFSEIDGECVIYIIEPDNLSEDDFSLLTDQVAADLESRGYKLSLSVWYLPDYPDDLELKPLYARNYVHTTGRGPDSKGTIFLQGRCFN